MSSGLLGVRGFLIDAPEYGRLRAWPDGALVIDGGLIAEVGDYTTLSKRPRAESVRWLHSDRVAVFPGLVDVHSHVPQYPAVARGTSELLPWLLESIFPLEREFTGGRVKREATAFFAELAKQGTTTAMLYTAIFEDSCDAAFQAADQSGLRVIMGKMMMDLGSYGKLSPTQILTISLQETERLCKTWHGAAGGRLEYAVSPRFAVACTEDMMRAAGALAVKHGTYIQTHLSENLDEIERVRKLVPWARDYTDVYHGCGLLGPRTVLGHCIHLSDAERGMIAAAGASVAHCPTANLFLRSGILPLEKVRAAGIRVGLGSDVAAGPELNLWRVMRSVIESQKARSFYQPEAEIPTPAAALHLATQGGATALGKGGIIGSFEVGKEADLAVIDYQALLPYRRAAKGINDLTAEDIVSLCIYRGGPEAVLETFVRGQSVYRAMAPELFEMARGARNPSREALEGEAPAPPGPTHAETPRRRGSSALQGNLDADTLRIIDAALAEDIGSGDLTSQFFVGPQRGRARIFAKQKAIVAGVEVAAEVFRRVDPKLKPRVVRGSGDAVARGHTVLEVSGPVRSILTGERVALNFIQRLSGVATLTRRFVDAVGRHKTRILDTRKTTPGLRLLEKAAVTAGGGTNHRIGLYDMVMVKDNHLLATTRLAELQAAIRRFRAAHPGVRVELEADTLAQVRSFLTLDGVDVILLDNMKPAQLATAVRLGAAAAAGGRSSRDAGAAPRGSSRGVAGAPPSNKPAAGRVQFEASGGVTLETVPAIAATGVDFISVGALTHSAPAVDFSLELL